MSYRIILQDDFAKERFIRIVRQAPRGFVGIVEEPKRTLDQNAKMHAMLADIALAKPMGRKHSPEEWKYLLMAACGYECMFLEGLDGRPFPVGFRSSRLTKIQMANLITYMQAFGDEHGVRWSEPHQEGRAA